MYLVMYLLPTLASTTKTPQSSWHVILSQQHGRLIVHGQSITVFQLGHVGTSKKKALHKRGSIISGAKSHFVITRVHEVSKR